MSQHDLDVANQTFPNHRADVNLALKAVGSNQSGSSAPGTTRANMFWYDTGNNILKLRNEADDAWIDVINVNQSATTAAASMAGALTTSGDMLYAGTAGANTRLAIGAATEIFTNNGLIPSWGPLITDMFATGILATGMFTAAVISAIASPITQANQAAVEAETNQDTYVPPDLLVHNPGIAKAWVKFDIAGTINSGGSQNVDSVTDTGTGNWSVVITTDFSSDEYAVATGLRDDSADGTSNMLTVGAVAVGTIQVNHSNSSGSIIDMAAADDAHVAAFGDQ